MNSRTLKVTLTILSVALLAAIGGLRVTFNVAPALAQGAPAASDTASMTCPKCKGPMTAGFIRDYFDTNSFEHAMWLPEGKNHRVFSWGKYAKVTANRCDNCGYLELYAK